MTWEYRPSRRYLNILIKGARQAGLDPDYVSKLESTPIYEASEALLKIRKQRPRPQDLRSITVAELAQHSEGDDVWVSVLGYVVQKNPRFKSHRGRDITTRALMHLYDIPLDYNDDRQVVYN